MVEFHFAVPVMVSVTELARMAPAESRCDRAAVTVPGSVTAAQSQMVLSLFPGIDLFGRGFEQAGFCVVRGPDPLFGGDIRDFHAVAGRFDGVIGGPPCPDFSRARRTPPTGYGLEMIGEFERVVREARPLWWLMENVPAVPDLRIDGYSHQRIDLNAREVGLSQNRPRHFQFGHRGGYVLTVDRGPMLADWEPCCVASEANRDGRRDWARFCELQGLSEPLNLDQLTLSARYRAVGNGVPVLMAFALARAVLGAVPADSVRLCGCGCGRPVAGKALLALPACRKRMQRRRDAVTDLV